MNSKYKDIGNIEDRVIEELGELIQAISKARRFGYGNYHPVTKVGNMQALALEISDVRSRLDEYSAWLNGVCKVLEDQG